MADTEQHLTRGCIAGDTIFQLKLYDQFAPKMLGVYMRYPKIKDEPEEVLPEGKVFTYIKNSTGRVLSKAASERSWQTAKELILFVQSLPAGYRHFFNLYVFEGYIHREIIDPPVFARALLNPIFRMPRRFGKKH